ncbi:MAG: SAM-dependent methyltransferase, partial [Deltaproteobacteria bacterium]|nr:SAM-dependent methyltransferase [Deltaproteobacteria bacterium]
DHANLGLADSPRSADDLARDAAEKPAAIAAFATVGPRKRVAELRARDGYLTEVLALAAYPYGKVFANNDPGSLSNADSAAWNARLEKPELADIARYDLPLVAPLPQYAAGLDVVVSVGAYGDAIRRNLDRSAMNAAVLRALHPGGLYVIADARAAAGADGAALCRATEKQVREEVEAAGFRFVEASEALSEAGDARTNGACQTSPGRSLDRFMLKFEKPAAEPAAASGPSK